MAQPLAPHPPTGDGFGRLEGALNAVRLRILFPNWGVDQLCKPASPPFLMCGQLRVQLRVEFLMCGQLRVTVAGSKLLATPKGSSWPTYLSTCFLVADCGFLDVWPATRHRSVVGLLPSGSKLLATPKGSSWPTYLSTCFLVADCGILDVLPATCHRSWKQAACYPKR